MKKINAEIVADSINGNGNRITTFLLTYPRFIHGEIMTHRVFSRNSASSRAIPFEKMVKMVEEDPFIPIAWQRNHRGMQGSEYITDEKSINSLKNQWIEGSRLAIKISSGLNKGACAYEVAKDENGNNMRGFNLVEIPDTSLTKQLTNRLLEPYMWHTVLVTATDFNNFFELRCPQYEIYAGPENTKEYLCLGKSWKDLMKSNDGLAKDFDTEDIAERFQYSKSQAEIHIQALAEAMWDIYNESTPKLLEPNQWHIPFGDKISLEAFTNLRRNNLISSEDTFQDIKTKISVARCARLSYMTFDGKIDYEKDIKLHDDLLKSKHFSPFEHVAKAPTAKELSGINGGFTHLDKGGSLWSGNFKGWIQYRQLIS